MEYAFLISLHVEARHNPGLLQVLVAIFGEQLITDGPSSTIQFDPAPDSRVQSSGEYFLWLFGDNDDEANSDLWRTLSAARDDWRGVGTGRW
jgi:hypothetical protein